jgi:hypothetical protein
MSRMSRRYITPIDTSGAPVALEAPHGRYVLLANTTYLFIIGGEETPFTSVELTSTSSAMVITSATIQDTNHSSQDLTDFDTTVGMWINEDPSTAVVGVDGTGWSATSGVVAAGGTGVGGAMWHLVGTGAFRTRLAVVVGATGGPVMVSAHGKN